MIRLTPLFKRVREGEIYMPSVIAYGKSDYVMRDGIATGWYHMLYINLWLIILKFDWQTGEKI